uniref:Uncharacterized protein n=1 Tax=Pan troglodytes TaxID=9598 RepID=A0A2I3S839_PANTR
MPHGELLHWNLEVVGKARVSGCRVSLCLDMALGLTPGNGWKQPAPKASCNSGLSVG